MGLRIQADAHHHLIVPDNPIIPYIEGDGIGREIWAAAEPVIHAAVDKAFQGMKKIEFLELLFGETSFHTSDQRLEEDVLSRIREYRVAIKGPLATPVGRGIRSLDARIRQGLDLHTCIRPLRYYPPVPSPVKHPEKVDIVVFRENTEDLYAGIEWDARSDEARSLINILKSRMNCSISDTCAIGIKPISQEGTRRLVIRAVQYALDHDRASVTLMHKGDIMKYTEGGFRKWGYRAAVETFGDRVLTEEQLWSGYEGVVPQGRVVIKDRLADMMFAQMLLGPEQFDVIACPNLNGDYISDAVAAQVGGLGISPGANIGDECAVFEPTHGTAPDIAGKDMANPCAIILSGATMLDHLGWTSAAVLIRKGVAGALASGKVTRDLASNIPGGEAVSCSQFGRNIVAQIKAANL